VSSGNVQLLPARQECRVSGRAYRRGVGNGQRGAGDRPSTR